MTEGRNFIWGPNFYGNYEIPDPYGFHPWESFEAQYDFTPLRRRVKIMASMIGRDCRSVMDLGCGIMTLKEFLKPGTDYIPVDHIKRDESTLLADFNKYQYPDIKADCVFMSGLLEYMKDMDWLIRKVCACCKEVIFSYHSVHSGERMAIRHWYGWVNNYTCTDLMKKFASHGFYPEDERIFEGAEQLIRMVLREKDK